MHLYSQPSIEMQKIENEINKSRRLKSLFHLDRKFKCVHDLKSWMWDKKFLWLCVDLHLQTKFAKLTVWKIPPIGVRSKSLPIVACRLFARLTWNWTCCCKLTTSPLWLSRSWCIWASYVRLAASNSFTYRCWDWTCVLRNWFNLCLELKKSWKHIVLDIFDLTRKIDLILTAL